MTLWESDVIMERARNRYIDSVLNKETEEDERYAEDCRENHSAILEEFEELKAKYENQLRYISLEELHDFIVCRYEEKDFNFEPFESLVLDYIENAKAWEDWEKKNPNYTDEQEEELDTEFNMIRDEMATILYKNNLI